jgi:DNA-binding beta-propeller fold protein YncE
MRPLRRLAFGLAVLLTACAAPDPAPPEDAVLVWPAAPAVPRVAYVRQFSRAEDLGIRKGWLERVADAVFGSSEQRLVRPMAVVQSGALLYVADPGVRGVHRFDRQGARHRVLQGRNGQVLPSPVGLAVGSAGDVYVTDSVLRKVFVIHRDADAAVEVPLRGNLQQPVGIAFDERSGRLLVVDTKAHHIAVFERDGTPVAIYGQRGEADGQFNFPTLLWRDKAGRLLVTDSLNFRVQVLDADGSFRSKFGRNGDGHGDLARHKGVATDSHGHIYVVDALQHALQVFDPAGQLLLAIGGQGRDRGEFWLPAGIFIDADNLIYVADAYNQRVQIFRYVGGAT